MDPTIDQLMYHLNKKMDDHSKALDSIGKELKCVHRELAEIHVQIATIPNVEQAKHSSVKMSTAGGGVGALIMALLMGAWEYISKGGSAP